MAFLRFLLMCALCIRQIAHAAQWDILHVALSKEGSRRRGNDPDAGAFLESCRRCPAEPGEGHIGRPGMCGWSSMMMTRKSTSCQKLAQSISAPIFVEFCRASEVGILQMKQPANDKHNVPWLVKHTTDGFQELTGALESTEGFWTYPLGLVQLLEGCGGFLLLYF